MPETNYFELAVAIVREHAKKQYGINLNDSSIHPEWETDDEENQEHCDNQTTRIKNNYDSKTT